MTTTATGRRALDRTVSENLATLMHRTGFSQNELARQIGVSHTAMSQKLRGLSDWRLQEVADLAGVLFVGLDELTGRLPDFEEWAERVRHQGLEPRTR